MMLDARQMLILISRSTPAECRELGRLLLAMADAPRDIHWRASFAEKLAAMPAPPESDVAQIIAKARARVAAEQDALRETGWHPTQMRQELEARGYTGTLAPTEPVQ